MWPNLTLFYSFLVRIEKVTHKCVLDLIHRIQCVCARLSIHSHIFLKKCGPSTSLVPSTLFLPLSKKQIFLFDAKDHLPSPNLDNNSNVGLIQLILSFAFYFKLHLFYLSFFIILHSIFTFQNGNLFINRLIYHLCPRIHTQHSVYPPNGNYL